MGHIRDLSEGLWSGALDPAQHHPFAPLMDVEPVGSRTTFVSSFANATAFDTDEGLVLVDTGSFLLAGQVHAAVRGVTKNARPPTGSKNSRPSPLATPPLACKSTLSTTKSMAACKII